MQKVAFRFQYVDLIMNVSACEMGLSLLAENNFPMKPTYNFLPRTIDAECCNGYSGILRVRFRLKSDWSKTDFKPHSLYKSFDSLVDPPHWGHI